jgi:tetratricopeptide (TPR) repeat protein
VQGRTSEAIAEYEKTLSLGSSDPRPYKSLGEIYEQRQEPEKSLHYYQEYLAKAPGGPDAQRIRQTVKELEARLIASSRTEAKPDQLPVTKKAIRDVPAEMNEGIEAYNRGDYDLCSQRMEKILKGDPGNSKASYYLKEASDKKAAQLAKEQILEGIRAAQQAFEGKAYQKCIEEATRVMELDPDNAEARKYLSLARMQVIPQEIQAVVNQYVQAFNSQGLLSFYQETCSPDLYQKIKNDVELIMSIYSNFRAVASNLNIRFKEINQAEASFSIVSTAVLKEDGRKQVLFEGTYVWVMENQGGRWKIIRLTAQPVRKEQLKKEDS